VKYDISDSLSVTGGVRYSHEKARGLVALGTADLVKPASLSLVGPPASWNSVTPRISVLYELSPQANLYFTFSKGFKSGAFNTASFQSTPVDPEKVTAFEGGIKGDLLSGLNIALSGFYQKYKDMQVSSLQQRPDLSFVQVLENAASSSMYGAELSGTWRVTDGFKLSFGGSYLHARYDNFPNAAVNVPAPGGNGLLNVAQDVSDKPMIRAPEFTGNISGVYDVETSLGRIELAASLFRSSSFVLEPSGRVKQPAYTNLNASIALWPNDMGIELKLYGKNLTNSTVIGQYGGGTTRETVNFTPPRSWGVEASYRF
jgi:iron complex outermembrane receptor protein